MRDIGQDYAIPCGSPVHASAAGTVVQSAWAGHWPNTPQGLLGPVVLVVVPPKRLLQGVLLVS